MQKKNQDPVAERTKAVAAAAAAMEVVASLAPLIDASNQIALEMDQQLAQELDPELPPWAAKATARSSGKRKAATVRLSKAKKQRKG
jgi:hypothetical protein